MHAEDRLSYDASVWAVEDDLLHVRLHDFDDSLNALRVGSGEILWSRQMAGHSAVVHADESVYLWDRTSSVLRSVGRTDGREEWEIQVGNPDWDDTRSADGVPVIAGDVIACQGDSHRLYAIGHRGLTPRRRPGVNDRGRPGLPRSPGG